MVTLQIDWAGLSVIIAILAHGAFTVWWASKITSQIKNLTDSLNRIDKELEKRDIQIAAVWKKVDGLGERVVKLEAGS